MPTNRHLIKTYLNDDEKAHIDALAAQLRLSRSDLLRRLVMSYRIPKAEDFVAWQGIRDLMKVNADQARLGNLFKLALDDAPDDQLMARLGGLSQNIAETQATLKACVRKIGAALKPRRT